LRVKAGRVSRGWLLAATLLVVPGAATAAVHFPGRSLRQVRQLETRKAGISHPGSLAFVPGTNLFYIVPGRGTPDNEPAANGVLDLLGDPVASARVDIPATGVAATFDAARTRLVLFDDRSNELTMIPLDAGGSRSAAAGSRVDKLGSVEVGGLAIDDSARTLYVLDRRSGRIAALPAELWDSRTDPSADGALSWIDLAGAGSGDLRGLAFDSSARRFSIIDAAGHAVREYDEDGRLVGSLDLADVSLHDPQAVVWAPSGDQTDDPSATSLYIADAGTSGQVGSARIVEVTEAAPLATASATAVPSSLVNTVETFRWSPPSPDPSGLAYDPTTNRLLVSDGEVDEMSIYAGVNYYETTLSGTVMRTTKTLAFTPEPTGVAYDSPARLFITDDDQRRVFVVSLGQNGQLDANDPTTSFSTSSFGSGDPEGITYDKTGNRLFIADGVNAEIYEVRAVDGVFGNGNDQVLHFDTKVLGVIDPESVEFNADTGTLFTIGSGGGNLVEATTSGALVTDIDTSELPLLHAAGVALAPRSTDPSKKSIYIADRKVDNDDHPTENDGAIYEIAVGEAGPPPPAGDVRVAVGSDDAEENNATGAVGLTSSDLEMVNDGSIVQTVGMRFAGVAIPQGATITNAYIQFVVDEAQSVATTLTLKAEAADNAATFTTATANVSSRPRSSAFASWSPSAWTTVGAAGADQRTPNLAALVQEVVNRPGWASGNALAFIVTGSGHRTAVAYNGSAANAGLLHLEYH
jgi:sugar lactone lactonase YvrE